MTIIDYGRPFVAKEASDDSVGTTEKEILVETDPHVLSKSQISIYLETDLGTHTAMDYRFYVRHETNGDWFLIPKQNISTNEIEEYTAQITNDDAPMDKVVVDFGLSATHGLRITAQGTGGAGGDVTVKLMVRDN